MFYRNRHLNIFEHYVNEDTLPDVKIRFMGKFKGILEHNDAQPGMGVILPVIHRALKVFSSLSVLILLFVHVRLSQYFFRVLVNLPASYPPNP